jgi:hypothetical protein
LKEYLDTNLHKEKLSTILRRSAGIPLLLTTLIKSHLPTDKNLTLSNNKVIEILKYSIETLLRNYLKCKIY